MGSSRQHALSVDSRLPWLLAEGLNRGGEVWETQPQEDGAQVLAEAQRKRLERVGVVDEFGQQLSCCCTTQAVFPEQVGVEAGHGD